MPKIYFFSQFKFLKIIVILGALKDININMFL